MTKIKAKSPPSKKLEINNYVEPKLLEDHKIPKLLIGKGSAKNEHEIASSKGK